MRSRAARVGLIAVALSAVALAPLATTGAPPAGAVTIAGARTLSDKVSVDWANRGAPRRTTDIHLLGWNDFHGNLEPAGLNIYGRFAGGAAYLAKAVIDRQKLYGSRQASVMAGDNIGASPLANGLFNEEPATIVANLMNTDFSSVGNHEFDKGRDDLLRIQNGGCAPTGCKGAPYAVKRRGRIESTDTFPGADFGYLSANVIDNATGKPLLPAYGVKRFTSTGGRPISIGFIGEVLQSTLGDVIADAQLAATKDATTGGALLALMNPGGVRADLLASDISSGGEAVGEVTFGEAFTVQPFGNSLVTKTMTGDMLRRVLEQQFTGCGGQSSQKVLQVSSTLTYQSNPSAADCAGKIGEIKVNGAVVSPTTSLRVTMNNFLAFGGDGFTVFNEGTDPLGGAQDIDALAAYLTAQGDTGVPVPATNRIVPST